MNELQIFKNERFGEIRTVTENGNVLFCAADVAKSLGYANTSKAISDHCKGVTKRYIGVQTGTKADGTPAYQEVVMNFIPRGDVFRLAATSKLDGAAEFESWIFDEVIPSVMEHGAYMTPDTLDKMIASPEFGIRLLIELKAEREKNKALTEKVEADKPKVLFANAVETAKTSILVGELAKILKQNGVEIGQNRLFAWMRDNGYLIKRKGTDYNMPTQYGMERGWFEIKESTSINPDGSVRVNKTPKISGAGQEFFINKFLSKE